MAESYAIFYENPATATAPAEVSRCPYYAKLPRILVAAGEHPTRRVQHYVPNALNIGVETRPVGPLASFHHMLKIVPFGGRKPVASGEYVALPPKTREFAPHHLTRFWVKPNLRYMMLDQLQFTAIKLPPSRGCLNHELIRG